MIYVQGEGEKQAGFSQYIICNLSEYLFKLLAITLKQTSLWMKNMKSVLFQVCTIKNCNHCPGDWECCFNALFQAFFSTIFFIKLCSRSLTSNNFTITGQYFVQDLSDKMVLSINMNISKLYPLTLQFSPTKWSNTLKPFVGNFQTNFLIVLGLLLKGLQ